MKTNNGDRIQAPTSSTITIVTNVFNEEENICAFLQDLKEQEYRDFDVIIIDDGSTDNTLHVIQDQMGKLPVRVISLDHVGLKKARAKGIEQVKSEYFVVIDADIRFDSTCIGKFVKSFRDPSVGAVSGLLLSTGKSWISSASSIVSAGASKALTRPDGTKELASGGFSAYRRTAVDQVGGFALERVAADLDISWKLKSSGWKIVAQNDITGYHRDPDTIPSILRWGFTRGQMGFYTRLKHREGLIHWPHLVRFGPILLVAISLINWRLGTTLWLAALLSFMLFVSTIQAGILTKFLAFMLFMVKSLGWSLGFLYEAVVHILALNRRHQ